MYVYGLQTLYPGISIADFYPRNPIIRKNPANRNWNSGQPIRYGSSSVPIMDTAASTVDTGTTHILLATGTSFYWI
jgi:hypothetical protein